ncbi:hypothetical protein [Longispora albida]|uniref:hypothetical protein n=1 Tax=Longispora albida TaxID=203523 RepID=UPI000364DC1C|nr:hypothetical protein [Longispora albida]
MWEMNAGVPAEFDLVWRGYDRKQVERSFATLEGQLIEALAERELLAGLPAELAAAKLELESLHTELDRLRAGSTDAADSRVLSVKMEAILHMAEQEAARIRTVAAAELAEARREAEDIRADANDRALLARRDFELALRSRREKEKHADYVLRVSAESEAEEILRMARAEAARIKDDASRHRHRAVPQAPSFLRWIAKRRRAAKAWA